jgi:predicted dehydrogenase
MPSPSSNALRLLQVGVGLHGRDWATSVIPGVTEVELVGYVDPDANALDALRKEVADQGARCFTSLGEAIAATRPHALLNTTFPAAHVSVTKTALDAGLHVLVEKPFALSLDAARSLVEMASAKRLVLMVCQNLRHYPAPHAIASLIRESSLGNLNGVSIDFRRDLISGPMPLSSRHVGERQLLVDMSIHHFDLLRLILGCEPKRVDCEAWNPAWSTFGGPSVAVASIVFDSDVVVSYRGSLVSAGPPTPWSGEWRLEFEKGEVFWTGRNDDRADDEVLITPRFGTTYPATMPVFLRVGLSAVLSEFTNAVHAGREPLSSGRDNLGTINLTLGAVESAFRRAPIILA